MFRVVEEGPADLHDTVSPETGILLSTAEMLSDLTDFFLFMT
jgi:hypothetical protein